MTQPDISSGARGVIRVLEGDCLAVLRTLPDASVQTCVTSPPYWGLRDYGHDGQIGMEATPEAFVARLVEVFGEVRRVLRDDGTLWLNIGDCYATGAGAVGAAPGGGAQGERWKGMAAMTAPNRMPLPGLKEKELIGIPWMLAFALRADGWYLRRDIIWAKPNPMPESVQDRPSSAHEYVFLLTKQPRYFYDAAAIREDYAPSSAARYAYELRADAPSARANKSPALGAGKIEQNPNGRNSRSVWTIATQPFSAKRLPGWKEDHDHFAVMPPDLAERCIKAGTSERGACPHCGAAWRRVVARRDTEATEAAIGGDPAREDGGARERDPTGAGGNRLATRRIGTADWLPSCDCPEHQPVPQAVLDPFGGAGTTGLVADRLGRSAILIELNAKNVRLARARLTADAPLLTAAE